MLSSLTESLRISDDNDSLANQRYHYNQAFPMDQRHITGCWEDELQLTDSQMSAGGRRIAQPPEWFTFSPPLTNAAPGSAVTMPGGCSVDERQDNKPLLVSRPGLPKQQFSLDNLGAMNAAELRMYSDSWFPLSTDPNRPSTQSHPLLQSHPGPPSHLSPQLPRTTQQSPLVSVPRHHDDQLDNSLQTEFDFNELLRTDDIPGLNSGGKHESRFQKWFSLASQNATENRSLPSTECLRLTNENVYKQWTDPEMVYSVGNPDSQICPSRYIDQFALPDIDNTASLPPGIQRLPGSRRMSTDIVGSVGENLLSETFGVRRDSDELLEQEMINLLALQKLLALGSSNDSVLQPGIRRDSLQQWMQPGITHSTGTAWSDAWSESSPNRWSSQSSSPSWSPGFRTSTQSGPSDIDISPSGHDFNFGSIPGITLPLSSAMQPPTRGISRIPPRLTLQPPLSPPYTSPSYVNLEPPSSPSSTQLSYHLTDAGGKPAPGLQPPSISLHPPMSPGSPRWPPTPPRASPHLGLSLQQQHQQQPGGSQNPHFNFQTLSVPSMLALLPTPPASPMSPRYGVPGSPMMVASRSAGSSGLQTPMLSPGSPRQPSLGVPMVSSPRTSPYFFGTSSSLMPGCPPPRSRSHSPSPIMFGNQPPASLSAPMPVHFGSAGGQPVHLGSAGGHISPSFSPRALSPNMLHVSSPGGSGPVSPRVPSPQELSSLAQSILQSALIKKQLEEQKERYVRRQQDRMRSPNPSNAGRSLAAEMTVSSSQSAINDGGSYARQSSVAGGGPVAASLSRWYSADMLNRQLAARSAAASEQGGRSGGSGRPVSVSQPDQQ